MTKYFRYLSFRGIQQSPVDSDAATIAIAKHWEPNVWNGIKMYERYALPVPCTELAKLNIYGSLDGCLPPTDPVLGVAFCWVEVTQDLSSLTTTQLRQAFVLQLVHSAVLAVADHFGFDNAPFIAAYQKVIDDDFQNEYCVGSPRSSPNRRLKAQISYRFDKRPETYVVIRDKRGDAVQEILFAHSLPESIGTIRWISNDEICVWHKNKRDHWLCNLNGLSRFVYPPAETGDAHALYRLATMLIDGQGVIPDYPRGMGLLQQAANAGYKHAQRRLDRESRTTRR